MPQPPEPLPCDPAVLVRMVLDLAAENARLRETAEALKAPIFGAMSEKAVAIDPKQGTLDRGDLATEATPVANDNGAGVAPKAPRACRPAKRNVGVPPQHLPRIETTLEQAKSACPCCAGLDPFTYLANVLERAVSGKVNDLDRLPPWAWKAERDAASAPEARAA